MNKTCNLCKAKIELSKINYACTLHYPVKLVEKDKKVESIPLEECPKPLSMVKFRKAPLYEKGEERKIAPPLTKEQQWAKNISEYCLHQDCEPGCKLFDDIKRDCFVESDILPDTWSLEKIEKTKKVF